MKVLYIHNSYSDKTPTGEEHASNELVKLLEEHGHEVEWFTRTSDSISEQRFGKVRAFFTGINYPKIAKELSKVLDEYKPDIVQVQNLYPLISSSIFKPLNDRKIPVVMRCPNYRLFCPAGLSLDSKGKVCERCWSGFHEINCVIHNCQHSFAASLGYALRNAFNRISGRILKGVDVFIVQSEFQKNKFMNQGIEADRIGIVPGISPTITSPKDDVMGDWVSFVGRVSIEKGIYECIEAARKNPKIPFKVAGFFDDNFVIPKDCPSNLEFMGFLKGESLDDFYAKSRIIVVPSKWYEGFPNVILRGFLFKRPVITTNIGAMQSIVETGNNGILVKPGDVKELSNAIQNLYPDIELCKKYGMNGCKKTESLYSREQIYHDLISVFEQAIINNKKNENI